MLKYKTVLVCPKDINVKNVGNMYAISTNLHKCVTLDLYFLCFPNMYYRIIEL